MLQKKVVNNEAAWPSGLRRQLQALVRKGASSNLAAVIFFFVVPNMPAVGRDSGRRLIELSARSCGPMDKASVYGTGDCRFESYQDQVFEVFILTFKRFDLVRTPLTKVTEITRSCGVTVSTLDSESSDGGSNPPRTLRFCRSLIPLRKQKFVCNIGASLV